MSMSTLRIALVQVPIQDDDAFGNLERMERAIRTRRGADLFLLPELWTTGYAHDAWPRSADEETPEIAEELARLSREMNAYIAGSMITRTERGGLSNRLWLFSPEGEVAAVYDKGHLFPLMAEDRYLEAGEERVAAPVRGWNASLSICFDLRFPEMYRAEAVAGQTLFLVVAEWPAERAETLRILARSRAIENQAYLALCNRLGAGADGTEFGGGSTIIAPDGMVILDAEDREGVFEAVIDASCVDGVRGGLPCLRLRREGLDW